MKWKEQLLERTGTEFGKEVGYHKGILSWPHVGECRLLFACPFLAPSSPPPPSSHRAIAPWLQKGQRENLSMKEPVGGGGSREPCEVQRKQELGEDVAKWYPEYTECADGDLVELTAVEV